LADQKTRSSAQDSLRVNYILVLSAKSTTFLITLYSLIITSRHRFAQSSQPAIQG
jgi:hypothetical protein